MWNVDNGSQGAVLPSAGEGNEMGTSPAFICLGQAWKFGQLPFLSFFLEGGPTGLPGNACFGFLAICILFKERLQEQIEAFSKKSVKNPNFFFPLSPFRFGIRRTIYIYTRHGGH